MVHPVSALTSSGLICSGSLKRSIYKSTSLSVRPLKSSSVVPQIKNGPAIIEEPSPIMRLPSIPISLLSSLQFLWEVLLPLKSHPGGNTDAGHRPGRAHGQNNGDHSPQRQSSGVYPCGRNTHCTAVAGPLPCRELDGGNAQICRRKNTGKESPPCRKLKMSPSSPPR